MVNIGRIHRELRNFLTYSSNLIKSDEKLMVEIRENVFLERRLEIDSTESKIVQFGLDFAEKSNFEVERKFRA